MQIYKFTNVRFIICWTENGGNGERFEFVKVSMQICSLHFKTSINEIYTCSNRFLVL